MKLEEIQKLLDEIPPAPWWTDGDFKVYKDDKVIEVESSHVTICDCSPVLMDRSPDTAQAVAQFIAASRTLMPKLLAVAKAAKELTDSSRSVPDDDNDLQAIMLNALNQRVVVALKFLEDSDYTLLENPK